jgi:hypothetical protein
MLHNLIIRGVLGKNRLKRDCQGDIRRQAFWAKNDQNAIVKAAFAARRFGQKMPKTPRLCFYPGNSEVPIASNQ